MAEENMDVEDGMIKGKNPSELQKTSC